ncbi:hypothetical protein K1T71_008449 [Dendrolimus kikuchii]|uniref:Uncharacterized protein n=1 Tax=Dendrolimus kikuchii TaxID=765133 RepID=A0ACC1CXJ0_9NEOP|nr:hypothetical protein K1T71_008449 [Dendrolimus kikuchii]
MYCDWPVLGRCCFCLPLRRGVLTFAYINIFFAAFLLGVYSYSVNTGSRSILLYHGQPSSIAPLEFCVALYCLEVIFNALLIYGVHTKATPYIKAYYYFAITTTVAGVVLQIIQMTNVTYFGAIIEFVILILAGLSIQVYLIILVSSLLRKLQMDGSHAYENQLHQIVSGEVKIEPNGIYSNPTVEPISN